MVYIPLSQIYLGTYFHLVSSVILYYDYLVTLPEEVQYVWVNPLSGASLLFFLNRYFAFLANIAVSVVHFYPFTSPDKCITVYHYCQIILIVTQVIVALIQFLKTYALYSRDKRVGAAILSVAFILAAMSIWAVVGRHAEGSIVHGCHQTSSFIDAIHVAVAWEALFVYDLMIFSLTLAKTYHERQKYVGVGRMNLVYLIVRDGAIYFGVMACAQCANILTFYLLPSGVRGLLSTFASSISVTMMSRFMLNLYRTAAGQAFGDTAAATSIRFTRTLFATRLTMGVGDSVFDATDSDDIVSGEHVGGKVPTVDGR